MQTILIFCGGDGSEHEISLTSAAFVEKNLLALGTYQVIKVLIHNHQFFYQDQPGYFNAQGQFCCAEQCFKVDCVIPVLHGIPGETGDIQAFLELLHIPYIGCRSESSRYCFNKVTTKLYLNALSIPNSPFAIISANTQEQRKVATDFFAKYQDVYVKSASQGSSIGCYHVKDAKDLLPRVEEAFKYSAEVIIEKNIIHRELEVAAYTYNGELVTTSPGEIIMPSNVFYTFDEKYSQNSSTTTTVEPKGLKESDLKLINDYARRAFLGLKLRDLSRIDFFLSEEDGVLINEINTFPGMTPISMFPKMLEHHGDSITEFFKQAIDRAIEEQA
ncbi:MAG: D-alanine--D-alanine ligase [Succinivibrio sp.]|nr:D-alanine--D-alanine ligase [Succinivibrio sp.]